MHGLRFALVLAITVVSSASFAYYGARFEPPDGTIYHGCGWNGFDSQAYYDQMFSAAHHPLVLQAMADIPGTRDMTVARLIQALTEPITHPDSQYIEYGVHFRDRNGMLDSVFALTTGMDRYIDTLALAFLAVNRPFFLRIGFEFNGDWNPYHPYIYPLAFRKLVSELHARGVQDFATVWCYEPDAPADFADSNAQGWKWYPGDDIVDWCGLDPFDQEHFNPSLPDSLRGSLTQKGRTEAFLRFAEQRRKPVYLNELSARHVFMVPDSLDPTHAAGQTDWQYWFVPFFEFVRNHPNIKGWNYINLDWTHYTTYADWGDARLEINSVVRNAWVDSLMESRFLNVGYDITQTDAAPEPSPALPQSADLSVFPNPFNPTTTIKFVMVSPGPVTISVFDLLGRRLTDSPLGILAAGSHTIRWDGARCASGVYLLRVKTPHLLLIRKMVLMR